DWRNQLDLVPTTVEYVGRLDEAAAAWHGAFVAHHYTRYLGDLSGGLMIGAAIRKQYGLEVDGDRSHRCDDMDPPARFRCAKRDRVAAAGWMLAEAGRVFSEVEEPHRLSAAMLSELSARHVASRPAPTDEPGVTPGAADASA